MNEIKEIKSWAAHGGGVTSLMFANNGLIASAGQDARVKLWNGNGELQKEFTGLTEAALQVALTGDANYIAGGDWNGQVQLWPATDPAQVKMIAANPPSIDRRLREAQSALASLEHEMAAAQRTALAASETAAKSQADLAAAQQSAATAGQQLAAATTLEQTLMTELTQFDSKIQDLEAQLAAARAGRQAVAQRSEQHKTEMAKLARQSQAAAKLSEKLQVQQTSAAAAADAAQQSSQALAVRLAAAQQATDQAQADKAALDARAAQLNQQQQQAAATVQALATQIAAAEQQAAELKRQLEEAEQAALDAQAQQRLFQESYPTAAPVQ
jgi:DNA repair exonuclease SbcCD ATPase subunit